MIAHGVFYPKPLEQLPRAPHYLPPIYGSIFLETYHAAS